MSVAADDDDDDDTAVEPLPPPVEDGRRAGNFTSDSVEKSGDIPDRGTTLVPFRVRPGEGHPPPPLLLLLTSSTPAVTGQKSVTVNTNRIDQIIIIIVLHTFYVYKTCTTQ